MVDKITPEDAAKRDAKEVADEFRDEIGKRISELTHDIPAEIAGVVEKLRKRAALHEAIRKMDKNSFCEQADISLAREAATLIERLAASQAEMER